VDWVEASHAPQSLLSADGSQAALDSLAGQRVAAFCGIGNPAGFQHTLRTCGYDVAAWREFPDHHTFTRDDVASLAAWADSQDIAAVVCTCKDLVKLAVPNLGTRSLWAVSIGMELLAGREALEAALTPIVERVSQSVEQ
jgi:tetraacyldisaccharide 4'-kinase